MCFLNILFFEFSQNSPKRGQDMPSNVHGVTKRSWRLIKLTSDGRRVGIYSQLMLQRCGNVVTTLVPTLSQRQSHCYSNVDLWILLNAPATLCGCQTTTFERCANIVFRPKSQHHKITNFPTLWQRCDITFIFYIVATL